MQGPSPNTERQTELQKHGLWWIASAAAFAVLAACLISPPVYWAFEKFAEAGWFSSLSDFPFHRFFSRTAQICMIVALVPVAFHLRIFRLSGLGLQKNPFALRDGVTGLFTALLPVLILAALYIAWDVYRPRKELNTALFVRIFLTAGVVAMIEEFLFRGVFLSLAVKAVGTVKGMLLVSGIFALVHFLKPAKASEETVTWLSGFSQIAAIFDNLPPWPVLGFAFCSLLLAGLVLAWATIKTRSLWAAIGLHAGWILAQQGLNAYAKFRAKPPEEFLPWVGPNVVSGVVPTGLLPLVAILISGLLIAGYFKFWRHHVSQIPS